MVLPEALTIVELHTALKFMLGPSGERGPSYWIAPVDGAEVDLLQKRAAYGLGKYSPDRKSIRSCDWLCFYAAGKGIIGHARAMSDPVPNPSLTSEFYPLAVTLGLSRLYPNTPVPLDKRMRSALEGTKNRNSRYWGSFVQITHRVSYHDFLLLARSDC